MLQQINELNERIEQLESRLAFQDDTIEILNQALTLQQQDLDKLRHQMSLLINRMKEMVVSQVASQSEETPPPHY
ncbi:SlyX family protein [Tolumonas auensis DSM 9187]|jgi:SlyX protein|uniref:Protein SlyX homolog n=1 Tax=Tolumonas auensis (strain DSM 9187 / NBRC 110442 / TA 4) TaxID=595494 RepID=C4L886_TOLAT|nr:SlyX family protein [Tolumonas auensis]ACQ93732.1 SlyX family protein [Tolumonas auensis DSM 9187]NCB56498.1 SlyX family protein [Gammaproteobacteria bacterium]